LLKAESLATMDVSRSTDYELTGVHTHRSRGVQQPSFPALAIERLFG
jgi:hypothetical protein